MRAPGASRSGWTVGCTRTTGRRDGSAWTSRCGRRRVSGRRTGCAPWSTSHRSRCARLACTSPRSAWSRCSSTAGDAYDVELVPGFTQYRDRVPYVSSDVSSFLDAGRNVVAVLLADGWFRGQVGMPRYADQFGTDLAVRLQLEAQLGEGWTVLAGTDTSWRTGPSHVMRADLIGGQSEDRSRIDPAVHDPSYDDSDWAGAVERDVHATVVRPVAPAGASRRGAPAGRRAAGPERAPVRCRPGAEHQRLGPADRPGTGRARTSSSGTANSSTPQAISPPRTSTSTCRSCPSRCRSDRSTR